MKKDRQQCSYSECSQSDQKQSSRQVWRRRHRMFVLVDDRSLDVDRATARNSQQRIGLALDWFCAFRFLFQRKLIDTGQPAVFTHAPHVIREKQQHTHGQEKAVQHIESYQRVLIYGPPAQEEETHWFSNKRGGRGDISSDCNRPISELIPGQ